MKNGLLDETLGALGLAGPERDVENFASIGPAGRQRVITTLAGVTVGDACMA